MVLLLKRGDSMENIKQLLDKVAETDMSDMDFRFVKEEFEKCFSSKIPDEVIKSIKYLDDYELYSPYQEAWQKIKEYYGIIDLDH